MKRKNGIFKDFGKVEKKHKKKVVGFAYYKSY